MRNMQSFLDRIFQEWTPGGGRAMLRETDQDRPGSGITVQQRVPVVGIPTTTRTYRRIRRLGRKTGR